jgi:4-amino-4-deoxy-L-arabinose transferase-like glycosyltransferase
VPTLNGRPFLEKPPLAYLLAVLACRAAGSFAPWALRLSSALLALATCAWVAFVARRMGSARAAAWAGLTLATSLFFFEVGHSVLVDMALTASVTFALGLAQLALVEPDRRQRWVPWFWTAVGLTFLAKGLVGPVMVLAPLALALVLARDRHLLRAFLAGGWGPAVALLLAAAWLAPLAARGGLPYLAEVFLRNSLGRFAQLPGLVPRTGIRGEHVEPWYYYLFRAPANVLPWLAPWLAGLAAAASRLGRRRWSARRDFLPLAFGVNLLLLSCSLAKREVYLLPVLPVSFLHLGLWLDQRLAVARRRPDPVMAWILALTLALAVLGAAVLPWILVQEAGVAPWAATVLDLAVLVLAAAAVRRLRRRDYAGALEWTLRPWLLLLAGLVLVAAPALDRSTWAPLQAPYRRALALHRAGAGLACAGLNETQLGYSSLTFRQPLSVLERPDQLRALLGQPGPVAVLVEPGWWARAQAGGVAGTVVPTDADQLPPRRRSRAPVLVINREPEKAGRGFGGGHGAP